MRSAGDRVRGRDDVAVRFEPVIFDLANWKAHWQVDQWSEEACEWVRRKLGLDPGTPIGSAFLQKLVGDPEYVVEAYGNLMLNEGIQEMQDLLIGAGGTTSYANANAQMGVGDSTTAEAATQTDLQAGANFLWVGMNATFPSRAAQTLTFQSDFTTAQANFAWQEASIRNGVTRNKNLNRKVTSLGTKATGTWTLTGTVAIT